MSDKVVDSVDAIESDLNFGSEEYASSDIEFGSEELIDDENDEDDEEDEDDEDDVSKYLFADFATTFFIRTDDLYTLLPIKAPLLNLGNESDRIAAQTVWITVQRFMGDLPEPRVWTPPKDSQLINYLENFIDGCPPQYTLYCKERLNRTVVNGTREQPPSWFEMQEATSNTKIELHITFMTGNVEAINADSATTARELCQILSERMGLKDQFGFSIYIELFDKVTEVLSYSDVPYYWRNPDKTDGYLSNCFIYTAQVICLGSGDYHIMDAVSQCEQFAKEQAEVIERNAPLRLFFRKEIFAPWHDPSQDAVATDLIYQQVVGGIKIGEYKCIKDDHLAMIAAQKYFIEYGLELSTDRLETLLSSLLPDNVLDKATARNDWKELIKTKLRRSYFVDGTKSRISIKEDVVSYAKHKLPLLFSSVCEVHKCSDPSFSTNHISIALNWTGIYIRDDLEETVLLKLSFPEILAVSSSQQTLTLSVVNGDVYIFWVSRGEEIEVIVMPFLDGLKRRSKYTIAQQDCVHHDATSLKFKKGDLIVLEQSYENVCASGWSVGKCDCTQESGNVPIKLLHVLPTLTKPPSELLQRVCSGLNASLR